MTQYPDGFPLHLLTPCDSGHICSLQWKPPAEQSFVDNEQPQMRPEIGCLWLVLIIFPKDVPISDAQATEYPYLTGNAVLQTVLARKQFLLLAKVVRTAHSQAEDTVVVSPWIDYSWHLTAMTLKSICKLKCTSNSLNDSVSDKSKSPPKSKSRSYTTKLPDGTGGGSATSVSTLGEEKLFSTVASNCQLSPSFAAKMTFRPRYTSSTDASYSHLATVTEQKL